MPNVNGPLFQNQEDDEYFPAELIGPGEKGHSTSPLNLPVTLDFVPASLATPVLPEPQLTYLLLSLKTAGQQITSNQSPLNLCLILDQSSSMRGDKLFAVKNAARQIVDQLSEEDYFTLVSFNDRPTIVVNCQKVASREQIKLQIDQIEAKGGTEIASGLFAGIQEMRMAGAFTRSSYILLLTDGQTYGDADRCVYLGEEAARNKIVIYPIGIGNDWNEDLLETVASKSNGFSEYIESPNQIIEVFIQKIKQLRNTLVHVSSLQFNAVPGVKLREIHRVSPSISSLDILPVEGEASSSEINLGPLEKNSEYSFLLELILPPCPPGTWRVADIVFSYSGAGTQNKLPISTLPLGYTFAPFNRPPAIKPEIKQIIERLSAYKLQVRAWEDIAAGDINSGTRRLAAVSTRLLNLGEKELASEIMYEVENLEKRGTSSAKGKKRIKYGTRNLTTGFFE